LEETSNQFHLLIGGLEQRLFRHSIVLKVFSRSLQGEIKSCLKRLKKGTNGTKIGKRNNITNEKEKNFFSKHCSKSVCEVFWEAIVPIVAGDVSFIYP